MKNVPVIALVGILACSCALQNDLDYPRIVSAIESFEVDGAKQVRIDAASRTVVIALEEKTDIAAVPFRGMSVSNEGKYAPLPEKLDLRQPIEIVLKTWQEYRWTISATQDIERYVIVTNQVQEAKFNLEKKTVFVYVPDSQPLSKITFESMKLEAEGSRILSSTGYSSGENQPKLEKTPISLPQTLDCVMERSFEVEVGNDVVTWRLKAFQLELSTQVTEVDAHCYSARVRGTFPAGGSPAVEYRKAGESEWSQATDVTVAGVGVTARLSGLTADTDYVCRIVNGADVSPENAFHTMVPVQPENMGFEDWHQDGKVWNPFPNGGTVVWDTANKATANFTGSATIPDESRKAEGKRSVRMESSYAVVKFASGSIFTGRFVGLQGLGAKLDWGIPFTSKPVGLSGQIAYAPAVINYADPRYASMKGQNDTGHVIIILTDWAEPFRIVSSEEKFVDFDNDPAIIAYGRYAVSENTDGFRAFHIDLEYRSDRTPKWLVIVGASSALGDYFTGGVGSTLWLDGLTLDYD